MYIHVVLGTAGLTTGTFILIKKKGDVLHKKVGMVFYYTLMSSALIALFLSVIPPNYFLFIIGIFTFYLITTGRRFLSSKKLLYLQKSKAIDWILTGNMLLFSIAFIVLGTYYLFNHRMFAVVLLVFGFFSSLSVMRDISNYRGKATEQNYWLLAHLQRMTGAYIASLTAFCVTSITFLLGVIVWLLPSVIAVPLVINWSKKHKVALK